MSENKEYEFTHKQALRNLSFSLFLMTLLLCAVLSLVVSELGSDAYLLEGAFVGFLNGLILGIFFNILFFEIWDPITLQHKSKGLLLSYGVGCLIPVSLLAVIFVGFLILQALGFSFLGWLMSLIITAMLVVIGYLFFRVWKAKPSASSDQT